MKKTKKKQWLKRLLLVVGMLGLLVVLTGCGTSQITEHSTGIWDRYIVYNFARCISFLSFGGNHAIGIILFTIIVRIILLPLMHYQTKQMRRTQEVQPKLKELQQKYSSRDPETQRRLQEEQQKLYAEYNVNPVAGCLPLLIQMPILMALWQAMSRVESLTNGHFLWMDLSQPDPYYILPILAAIFTYLTSKLTSMSQIESNMTSTIMNFVMPIMIFFMGMNLASGLSLYWVVSNAFQAGQTLLLNNPYKIRREREEKQRQERHLQSKLYHAQNGGRNKKKKKK